MMYSLDAGIVTGCIDYCSVTDNIIGNKLVLNRRGTEEPVRCVGSQGTPLGGFADLKEVPPRCSNWRDAERKN